MSAFRATHRRHAATRFLSFVMLLATGVSSGCSDRPSGGEQEIDWKELNFETFSVSLPGRIDTNSYSDKTGAHSFVSTPPGMVVSLCLMPFTTVHLAEKDVAAGGDAHLADNFATIFPALRGESLKFDRVPGVPLAIAHLVRPEKIRDHSVVGNAWRIPDSGWFAFLIVVSNDRTKASATAERVRGQIRSKPSAIPSVDPEATTLEIDVPDDWILNEDVKKGYWAKPSGTAFIYVSKPFPAPGSTLLPRYGMNQSDAEQAITAMENLSGRTSKVGKTTFHFDKKLWMILSRAAGTVEYKSGTFAVEMDRWINPHTGNWHRVYVGGLRLSDLAEAKAIRATRRFVRPPPGG
jgi:hypothetical protein